MYAGILGYLIAKRAGHVWGPDGLIERWHVVESYPALKLRSAEPPAFCSTFVTLRMPGVMPGIFVIRMPS